MKARVVKSENPVPYLAAAVSASADDAIIARALEILAARHEPGKQLGSPADTVAYLRLTLAEREREFFAVLFLDNRHRVIALEELFSGTIDGASVHPREVVRRTLQHNAAALILAHNHPSGVAEPSQADEHITRRLREALALIDVRVLDHIVVASQGAVSMAERGMV